MNDQPDRIVERWTDVAGLPMFSRTSEIQPRNPAPAVVLIHGLSVSSRPFLPTLRALAPDYPVHALDLPGFGRSAKPRRALDIPALAIATADWMHATGIDRAVLVGHSMGAQVAVELAHRHPDRVAGIVLVSPTGDPNAGGIGRQILRLCLDGLREPPLLTALVLRDYLRAGLGRSVSTLRAMNAHPMPARLESLSIPSLLVVGDRDPVVPRDWAREVIECLPRGRIVVIDDGTHGIQYAEPDALAGTIRDDIQAERLS